MQFINKHKQTISKTLLNYLMPLLLCYSVMRIIIKTYFAASASAMTALSVVYMTMLFFVYEKIKPKKILRAIVFLLIGAAVVGACSVLMNTGWRNTNVWFMNWFYVSGTDITRVSEYEAVIFIFFGFFLASVVYYFSIIRFRASGLMLAVILPFIIYGKRSLSIDGFDMTLMVTVYLGLVFHCRLTADDVKRDTVFNYSYVITALVFVTFVGMITMFVPKPQIESYLENNRNFFDFRIDSDLNAFSSLNEESSDRFGASATGETIFRASTNSGESVLYLRRQTFDTFRREKWVSNRDLLEYQQTLNGNTDPTASNTAYRAMMISAAQKYTPADEQFKTVFDQYAVAKPLSENDLRSVSLYYEESFRPAYIPAVLTIEPRASDNTIRMGRSAHSEVYPYSYNSELGDLTYYYYPITGQMETQAKNMPFDTAQFYELLKDMRSNGVITARQYRSMENIRYFYTSDDYYTISDDMKQLAQQITINCSNDYEKANAIVNYFATNGYTYDMDYIPPDESIDYFVFQSKKGSCTSYATAMTLMARSLGLPTRYVEGFAAYEKDPDDPSRMIVRDTNAHAFVECFIAGIGWMTFDPTVPEYMAIRSNVGGNASGTIRTVAMYLGRAALFLGAAFVIIFIILLDRIDERIFRIRNHAGPLDVRTMILYRRVIKLLNRSHTKTFDGYTPEAIGEYVRELGGNIDLLIALFQSTCFGSIEPTPQQFGQAYEQYKQSWRVISKGKRPEKPQKVVKKPQIQGNL